MLVVIIRVVYGDDRGDTRVVMVIVVVVLQVIEG